MEEIVRLSCLSRAVFIDLIVQLLYLVHYLPVKRILALLEPAVTKHGLASRGGHTIVRLWRGSKLEFGAVAEPNTIAKLLLLLQIG